MWQKSDARPFLQKPSMALALLNPCSQYETLNWCFLRPYDKIYVTQIFCGTFYFTKSFTQLTGTNTTVRTSSCQPHLMWNHLAQVHMRMDRQKGLPTLTIIKTFFSNKQLDETQWKKLILPQLCIRKTFLVFTIFTSKCEWTFFCRQFQMRQTEITEL